MSDLFLFTLSLVIVTLVGAMWIVPSLRGLAARVAFLVPIAPFMWALNGSGDRIAIPWFLAGAGYGVDETGRPFLAATAALWFFAALYGRRYLADDPRRATFDLFFFLTMVGNIALVLAHDVMSFLTFYTLMSVAAYGLVVHQRREADLFAGRVYIALTIVGEMLLFAGVTLAMQQSDSVMFADIKAAVADSAQSSTIAMLILLGFGIKLGIMPLHVWLPLAHPAAPTPASAVLSGAMIKTGLLGILRVLPIGTIGFSSLADGVLITSLVTVFVAALIGSSQSDAKSALAYSSISQMGLLAIALGAAMMAPESWALLFPAVAFFVVHHAVAKASLFMGYGVSAHGCTGWQRFVLVAGLFAGAFAIAGLPFTSGYVAKGALKTVLSDLADPWGAVLRIALPLSGVTTTLVMARFVILAWPKTDESRSLGGLFYPWAVLTAGVVLIAPLGIAAQFVDPYWGKLDSSSLWNATWPITLASFVAVGVWGAVRLVPALIRIRVPQGDILHLALRFWRIPVHAFAARDLRETKSVLFRFGAISAKLRDLPRRLAFGRVRPIGATDLFVILLSALSLILFLSMSSWPDLT